MDAEGDISTLREIEHLKRLAQWYRSWAKVAGSEAARDARLKLAEHIEGKVRTLAEKT